MRRFALAGNPISHSMSPELFSAAYPGRDFSYELLETGTFDEAFGFFMDNLEAMNVTAPFKEEAFLHSDTADMEVEVLKAANILRKETDGSIRAFNSDCTGVRMILEGLPTVRRVLVVGCGGAGRAAALASHMAGLETAVANRSFDRAAEFCARADTFPCSAGHITPLKLEDVPEATGSFDTIIYTLPVPMAALTADLLAGRTVLEANYRNPSCHHTGVDYIPGLEWLCAQAICGFGRMTGEEPDERLIKARAACNKYK